MAKENTADFKVSGKISLAIVGVALSSLLGMGSMIANYYALEKRVSVLEAQVDKTCGSINKIEVINGKIETNLEFIKGSLQEHTRNEKGGK